DYACLTVVSPGTPWDESKLAESTATRFGCRWIRVEPSPGDMALELESMARFMGEPFNGLSVFAQYKVMEQARQNGLKVMLDGQGGDELFTGYPRMAQILILDRIKSLKWFRAWNDLRALRKHACQPVSRSLMSMIYFQTPRIAWRRNRCRMAPFVDPELADHVRWETVQTLYGPVSFAARQTQEFGMSCLPRLLRYEDRNSMAFSVEARVPILGREVVDLALKLPAEWKVRHGWTKYIIRCNMDGILPDDVVWNSRKQGFDVPEALWMSILSEAIVRWLEECRDVPVNCHAVRSALRNGGAMNQWFWRLVSFVLWARVTGVGI
ncbi:MAG TPA: asparagine synthase C-terminal domain-containing protein, partial [bacterium]|nr:asparagine synthase C-terminal domain-containing protein [bacterium]